LDALALVEEHKPEVLILDMDMPAMNGIAVIKEINRRGIDSLHILVLSGYYDRGVIQEIFRLGADAYITKEAVPELLIEVVTNIGRDVPPEKLKPVPGLLHYRNAII